MTTASDNVFPKIIGAEGAAPGTPAAATSIAYVKADGLWYSKDDAGVETLMSGGAGGGSVATDAIWDAAGDLAVGTGANTAARIARGTTGQRIRATATTVEWFTPISNNIVATDETLTGNSTWVDLATAGPAVTATVGASGIVKITLTARIYNSTGESYSDMGFAVSGANTISAGTANKILRLVAGATATAIADSIQSATFLLTGLSAGSTTFTAKYNQQGGGGTSHWANREIIIEVF